MSHYSIGNWDKVPVPMSLFSDESSKVVTEYTTTPVAGSTLDTVETVSVTVSYTEGEITKTASFDVEVSEAPES